LSQTEPPAAARASSFGGNLVRRVGTALVALPLLLLALFLGPDWLFVGIVAGAVAIGAWEFFDLAQKTSLPPFRAAGLVVTAALFLEVAFPAFRFPVVPAVAAILLAFLLWRHGDFGQTVGGAASTLLGGVYLGALGGAIAGLRLLPPDAEGPLRVLLLCAIIMGSDTLAFFTGRALGRHPLAPRISPGKTVEGALGGLAGGVAGALAVRALGLDVPLADGVLLGVAVAAAGTIGDLVESLFKRWAGVKDSGVLFPGHGGMLDRLDSLLFGAPVLYYYFLGLR
jgi:phosphatidate cytidylyltransferase